MSTTEKMPWNNAADAEDVFEHVSAEYNTSLIRESVIHCISEADSNDRLAVQPPVVHMADANYPGRMAAYEKSLQKLNNDANKAMGMLLSLFDPECNCHRSLIKWFSEAIVAVPPLDAQQLRRKDFNYRNAYNKWLAEYKPNKQINYDTEQADQLWTNLS